MILRWEFSADDRQRMHTLLERAKADALGPDERVEAEISERVGHLLSILKANAWASLRHPRQVS